MRRAGGSDVVRRPFRRWCRTGAGVAFSILRRPGPAGPGALEPVVGGESVRSVVR